MANCLNNEPASVPHPHHVLLVEDSETDTALLEYLLHAIWPAGHALQLDCVGDAYAALTALLQSDYDLLLLDWRLPGFDADHVLQALPKLAPHLPVVVITGLSRSEIPVNLEELGAVFLSKDELNRTALSEAIRTALNAPHPAGHELTPAVSEEPEWVH